jgi:hypothetical protein
VRWRKQNKRRQDHYKLLLPLTVLRVDCHLHVAASTLHRTKHKAHTLLVATRISENQLLLLTVLWLDGHLQVAAATRHPQAKAHKAAKAPPHQLLLLTVRWFDCQATHTVTLLTAAVAAATAAPHHPLG